MIVDVFRLVRDVLADDGTCWINYGDSYAGSPAGNTKTTSMSHMGGRFNIHENYRRELKKDFRGLKPKDLVGMPWRIALALQSDGWWLRSDIIWAKANPMPESVTDRPTRSHEYLFLLTKNSRYFYDAEAVREPHSDTSWASEMRKAGNKEEQGPKSLHNSMTENQAFLRGNPRPEGGRNRRTVWNIATEAYSEAHFATFPRKLVEPCILAGTSTYGHCPECGARWVRVVEKDKAPEEVYSAAMTHEDKNIRTSVQKDGRGSGQKYQKWLDDHPSKTTGWRPTCDCCFGETQSGMHYNPVPDIVLDPFFGSGTVGLVAEQLGRKYIGIELSEEYSKLAREDTKQEVMRL